MNNITSFLASINSLKKKSSEAENKDSYIGVIQAGFLVIFLFLLLQLPSPEKDIAFFVICGIIFLLLSVLFFRRAWLTFLFLLPFLDLTPPLFEITKLPVYRMSLIIVTLCFFFFYKKGFFFWRKLFRSPGFTSFGLFVLASLISALHALNMEAIFRALTYIEPMLFFLLTYYLVSQGLSRLRTITRTIIAGGIIVSALGLMEIAFHFSVRKVLRIPLTLDLETVFQEDRFGLGGRIASTISHPVYAGIYFLILLILLFYFIFTHKPKFKPLLLVLIPIYVLLILGTGSRAVIVSLIFCVFSLVFFSKLKKRVIIPVAAVTLILLVIFIVIFPHIFQYFQKSASLGSINVETRNIRVRIEMTNVFINVFRENLIFGYGPGLIQKEALGGTSTQFEGYRGVENQYAIILADSGLIGGIAYLLFLVGALLQSLKISRAPLSRDVQFGGLMLFLIFIAYFIFVTSETCLTLVPNFLLMAIYGGVVAQFDKKVAEEPNDILPESSLP